MARYLQKLGSRFFRNARGSASIPFALSIIPVMASVGAAIDLGRSVVLANNVQVAVDNAVLSAVALGADITARKDYADRLVLASLNGQAFTSQMRANADGSLSFDATVQMPTMFMSYVIDNVSITRSATALATVAATPGTPGTPGVAERRDDSCILSLGEDLDVNFDTIVFNGNPSVLLTNCSLISNKSMKCNGNNIGAAASYARGSITSCPNPHPGQPEYPDIYASLMTNIQPVCGTLAGGYTWTPNGTVPAASTNVKHVTQSGYTEVHICGNLTFSGSGSISGLTPSADTVIVIENGGLVMTNEANVKARRTSFVIAGANAGAGGSQPIMYWPTGTGKKATLDVSTSTGAGASNGNPWKGMAIYQHPSINLDQDLKPGSSIIVDGIVYLSKAKLTVGGNISYGASACSKLVAGEFTLNGNVALKQDATSCAALGVTQFYQAPVPEVAAVAGNSLQSSYLTR